MKRIICFFLGHKWTSKALKGLPPKQPLGMDSFRDHAKMHCDRCGKNSSLNNRLLSPIILLCCLVGCVSKQKPKVDKPTWMVYDPVNKWKLDSMQIMNKTIDLFPSRLKKDPFIDSLYDQNLANTIKELEFMKQLLNIKQ